MRWVSYKADDPRKIPPKRLVMNQPLWMKINLTFQMPRAIESLYIKTQCTGDAYKSYRELIFQLDEKYGWSDTLERIQMN